MEFVRRLLATFIVLAVPVLGPPPPVHAQRAPSGHVEWQGWSLDYGVTNLAEGLALTDVFYQGVSILAKASFPIMRVFYGNDVCGPYVDRLAVPLTPVSWANDALLVQRTFIQNGQTWLELGIQDTIGNYVIYQVWYLSEDGVMDAHLFSKGLQCNFVHIHLQRTFIQNGQTWLELGIQDTIGNYVIYQVWYLSEDGVMDAHLFSKGLQCNFVHIHYPYWRLDFDLGGGKNDQIRMYTDTGWQTYTREFNAPAADATNHRWQVRDTVTGLSVDIFFDDNSWDVAGTVVPEQQYSNNLVLGRRYHEIEDNGWRYSVRSELPQRDGEEMDGQDIVFWYKAYIPHSPEEGPDLWHSTGIRLVITGAAPSPGDNDYCAVNGPCGAGEGDCDGNHECQAGLICRNNVGATYGFQAIVDVCVASAVGDNDYCAVNGPCGAGEGDCDGNHECQAGLICRNNVGAT